MQAIDQMVEVSMQTIALEKQQWMDQDNAGGEEAAKAAAQVHNTGHHQHRAHRKEEAPGTDTLEVEGEEGDPAADGEASDKGEEAEQDNMDQDLREEEPEGQEATTSRQGGTRGNRQSWRRTTWDRDEAPPTKPQPTQKWKHNGQHTGRSRNPRSRIWQPGRLWGT
jgi:hypothetical protein